MTENTNPINDGFPALAMDFFKREGRQESFTYEQLGEMNASERTKIAVAIVKKYVQGDHMVTNDIARRAVFVIEFHQQALQDIKADFPATDYVGNQHYVFNIRGNKYRLVVVIKFTVGYIFIRFVGTHSEYDKIDCSTI